MSATNTKTGQRIASGPMVHLSFCSNVERTSISAEHAFVHHLRQRRMREDGVHQFLLRRLKRLANGIALDQFGDFRAHHMRAQQFARRLVAHRFDKAFRFAQRYGLAVADEGEFADRSDEQTSELQSLMRISYAVFCLKKKTNTPQ